MEPSGPTGTPRKSANAGAPDIARKEPDPVASTELGEGQKKALQLQVAAVAAQQVALDEEEARLQQRCGTLQQQEEQLASHLEEKRRRLERLNQRAHAERTALQQDRAAYQKYIDKVTGDLSQAQRELVENQQRVQAERRRLAGLHRKIKQRWKRLVAGERAKIARREEELANEACNLEEEARRLQQREQALAQERLQFHGDYELGRRRLRDAWQKLRQAQAAWRLRRRREHAALSLRDRELEQERHRLAQVERRLHRQHEEWDQRQRSRDKENEGLENRIRHQRKKLADQQLELARLDDLLRQRRQQLAGSGAVPEYSAPPAAASTPGTDLVPASATASRLNPKDSLDYVAWEARLRAGEDRITQRAVDLGRLAGDLADQRLQLAEHWQRLLLVHHHWHVERARAAVEIDALANRLGEQEQVLANRAAELESADAVLQQRHEHLAEVRQQIVAWRARLRTRETAWENDRNRVLTEIKHREELVEQQLAALMELRERWTNRRRQEMEHLKNERSACHALRHELGELRRQCAQRFDSLENQKRQITEKALALEQYRQALIKRSGDGPALERRVERLRRRWIAQNRQALRDLVQQRQMLHAELGSIESRCVELTQRNDKLAEAMTQLAEKETAFEHKQTLTTAQQARLQQEVQIVEGQRHYTEQQLLTMKDEVERIARSLLEQPDPPALSLPRAA